LKPKTCFIIRFVSIGFVILSMLLDTAHAAEPKRVAVLPFKINAEKDLSYLREGIRDMLTSRLTKEGEVLVIGRPETDAALAAAAGAAAVTEPTARQVGAKLNADYVLYGSLTVIGNSASMDAKMLDVAGNQPLRTFFAQRPELDGIIPKVDEAAADINRSVFGQTRVAQQAPSPKAEQPKQSDVYMHPEKLLKQEGLIEREDRTAFVTTREESASLQSFWKSPNFKMLFNGLALGDVDGDGKLETVVLTTDTVLIFRFEGGRFYKAHEIPGYTGELIAVDVADINNNGTNEIFVTGLNATKNYVDSFVLEYDGQNFNKIVTGSPWAFRVADLPHRGKVLLGQRLDNNAPFRGAISEMVWQGGDYVAQETVRSPRQANVLGFTLGDVMNDGQEVCLAFNETDRIQIMDTQSGEKLWQSSEQYGGSHLYMAGPKREAGDHLNRRYLPMRLLVTDLKDDGTNEVVVVKNFEMANRLLQEFRKFSDARIEGMVWDGLGLSPQWQTRKISGFIRDYGVGDFDNDGRQEIVAAVVSSLGSMIMSEPKSSIIAYEIAGEQQ